MVRGGADFSKIKTELEKTQKNFKSFQGKIGTSMKIVGAVLSTLAIGTFVKDSVKAAMEVESSVNQLGRTMGASAGEFIDWAKTQASSFGMARSEAYKYGAVYSNLITTFAKDSQEATRYTTDLLKASAVVASATGRTMEDTMERIRSGLLGNTEAIEDLGINVNVALLESTKAFQQFAKGRSWQQLSFQEQQQIRLMAILEQANIKYGDTLAGTTATNQMKFLATLKNIQLNIGQDFLPIYNVVLPLLNSLASKLEVVTANLAQFMQILFGTNQEQANNAKTASNAAKSQTQLAKATKAAGTAAKKGLASFDELNVLQKKLATGGEDAAGAVAEDTTPGTGKTDKSIIPQGVIDTVDKIKQTLSPAARAFGDFAEAIGNLGTALKNNPVVQWWLEGTKKTLSNFGMGILYTLSGAFEELAGWINLAAGAISGNFETALKGMEQMVSGAFDIVTGIIYPFFPSVAEKMQKFKENFSNTWASLKEDVKKYGDPTKLEAMDFALFIRDKISGKLEELKNLVAPKLASIKDSFITTWTGIKTGILSVWDGITAGIKGAINGIIKAMNWMISGINKIRVSTPDWDWLPDNIQNQSWSPKIPPIPPLANGGLAYGKTLAMVGDNINASVDPEVISPLSKLQEMLSQVISQSGYNGPDSIVLKIGETEFGRIAINAINNTQRQAGRTLLQV